jgi:hypothetical protein
MAVRPRSVSVGTLDGVSSVTQGTGFALLVITMNMSEGHVTMMILPSFSKTVPDAEAAGLGAA